MQTLTTRVFSNGNSQAVPVLHSQRGTALMEALRAIHEVDVTFIMMLEEAKATPVTHNTREFKRISGLSVEDWVENS